MKNRNNRLLIRAVLILAITMACGLVKKEDTQELAQQAGDSAVVDTNSENAGEESPKQEATEPTENAPAPEQESDADAGGETAFPVTEDATNLSATEDSVNFQTGMSLNEAMEHYRRVFSGQGLTEDGLLTVTSETTFSMVFKGSPDGRAVVIQGVDLGNGSTNINIRYEDI